MFDNCESTTSNLDVADPPQRQLIAKRLQCLYELTRRINAIDDYETLLAFVLDQSLTLTGAQQGLLFLNDRHGNQLRNISQTRTPNSHLYPPANTSNCSSYTKFIQRILTNSEPQLIRDLRSDSRYNNFQIDLPELQSIGSLIATPLKIGEQLVGGICLHHPKMAKFHHSDLEFLRAFAGQAAFAIHHNQKHDNRIKELTRLHQLSRSLVQVLDLEEVLTRIVSEATHMLNVETGSVLLKNQSELQFATSVVNGKQVKINKSLRLDEGVAGWVVSQGKAVVINDTINDTRWFGEVMTSFQTTSLLCVPLQINGRTLGALEILNKKGAYGFDRNDETLLSAFAVSATIAIENARLFEKARQAEWLQTLNEAALDLSSTLKLDNILCIGLEKSLITLHAKAGAVFLDHGDNPGANLLLEAIQTVPAGKELTPTEEKITFDASTVMTCQQVDEFVYIDKNSRHSILDRNVLKDTQIKALAITPIKTGDKIIGTLAIFNHEIHTYSPDEKNWLQSLGRIIGLAVQNASHYNQAMNQATHLGYLNQIASALTRSFNIATILTKIVEAVGSLLDVEYVAIFLPDSKDGKLSLSHNSHIETPYQITNFQKEIANWVINNNRAILTSDDVRTSTELQQIARKTGQDSLSLLAIPFRVEKQIIGVVTVLGQPETPPFTKKSVSLLEELTSWMAIALHNAKLYDEKVKAYQRLNAEQQLRVRAETYGATATMILDMTHTMNNIIGAIRVWASKLENVTLSPIQFPLKHFKKEIVQIRQNAEEAIGLIGSMVGPLNTASTQPTKIHDCLNSAIQSLWWPDNIKLHTDYASELPLIKANGKRLEMVFHNLLSNAIQALADELGNIYIQTNMSVDNWVIISISDDGPGVPENIQATLFDSNVSGKKNGLGLGLWLAQTFLHQIDGQIRFDNSSSERTIFKIMIPAISQANLLM